MEKSGLTHFNAEGRAKMVDVSAKSDTQRSAVVQGTIYMQPATFKKIQEGQIAKGDVLAVAQVAGVMGAKRTPDLIPMCHPILLTGIDISFELHPKPDSLGRCAITISATVKTTGPTGVEMDALSAVAVAGLTIYDMCKAIDKGMTFGRMGLVSKTGGKSGTYLRKEELVS